MKIKTLALLTLAGFAASERAQAGLLNGDFSLGLSNWSSIGDVSIQSGAAFLTTAAFAFEDDAPAIAGAFNYSGFEPVASTSVLDSFSNLAAGALDPNPGSLIFAYEGSGLKQSFSVNAGDSLSFDWKLFTNDAAADYAYVVINGVKTDLGLSSIATIPSGSFAFESGLNLFSQTFLTAQSVDLSFGVVDVNDFAGSTAFSIDNVQISPIPEPSTAVFGLLCLGTLFSRRRRR